MKRLAPALPFVLLGALASAGEKAAAPKVPANTWVEAKPKRVLPGHIPGAWWTTGDGYCGSTYRTKTGTILSRTGIKSLKQGYRPGFYSNATLEWDLAGGEARVVEVSRWGGGSSGRGKLLPGFKDSPTPSPRHTYDGITYVESQDAMYIMLGAYGRIRGNGCTAEAAKQLGVDHNSTWKYSFKTGRWKRIEGNVNKFFKCSPYETHLQYWPEGGKLIFLNDGGGKYAEFDLATGKWAQVALKNKCPQSLYHARSTWDSRRALWVFRRGPQCCTFNPKTREFKALPDNGLASGDKKGKLGTWKGVAYIAKHDAYLVTGPTGNDTRVYEVAEGKWKSVKGGDIALVNGYAQYDPRTGLVGLVFQLKNYVFRYVPEKKK